jgi:ubiquinone/menaquinone biosynthesis C-methylase UbiE
MVRAEHTTADVARVEAAVREQYEDTANFAARRSLRTSVSVGHPVHERLLELFDFAPGATVVDVGCGDGVWASLARGALSGGKLVGVDLSAAMLRDAGARDARVVRVRADATRLPLRDRSADVVLALWMLYHVDASLALPGIARVLRPGGRLIATTSDESLLPGLDDVIEDAAREVAGRPVRTPIGRLRFNVTNGRAVLAPYFARVDEFVDESEYEVSDAAPILSFIESLRAPASARLRGTLDFDALLAAVRRRLDARLEAGPMRLVRRSAFFIARNE